MDIKCFIVLMIIFITKVSSDDTTKNQNQNTTTSNLIPMSYNLTSTSIRNKREPLIIKARRPLRLKRIPTIYRARRPPPKTGPSPPAFQKLPPKPRYGPPPKTPSKQAHYIYPLNDYNPENELSVSFEIPLDNSFEYNNNNNNNNNINNYNEAQVFSQEYSSAPHSSHSHHKKHKKNKNKNEFISGGSSGISSSSSSISNSNSFEFKPSHSFSSSYEKNRPQIPSTSYGVPSSSSYFPASSNGQQQQQQQHHQQQNQYQSQQPQQQSTFSTGQGNNGYSTGGQVNNNYAPSGQGNSYSMSQSNSYSLSPINNAAPQPTTYSQPQQPVNNHFAEPPVQQNYNNPPPQQPFNGYPQQNTVNFNSPSPSVTSYNTSPQQNSYSPASQQTFSSQNNFNHIHNGLQGGFNTPIPSFTTKNSFGEPPSYLSDFSIPTPKYEFELDTNGNSGDLYETSISSYDVPLHYDSLKTIDESRKPITFDTNDFFDTTSIPLKKRNKFSPPILPNTYDQEQFSRFSKNKNKNSGLNLQNSEELSYSQFFDDSLLDTQTFGKLSSQKRSRTKAPPITNLNVYSINDQDPDIFESYEYSSESFPKQKFLTTTTTKRPRYRRKKHKFGNNRKNPHVLDSEDLRDAFGSSSEQHISISKPENPNSFESLKKSKPLLFTTPNNTENKYHSNYTKDFNIVSIQKSNSHSYYAGTMAPSLASNFASKRFYDTNKNNNQNNDNAISQSNVVSSGFYVADTQDTEFPDVLMHSAGGDQGIEYDDEIDLNEDYDIEFSKRTRHKNHNFNSEKTEGMVEDIVWDGVNLPKNHKFTVKDIRNL